MRKIVSLKVQESSLMNPCWSLFKANFSNIFGRLLLGLPQSEEFSERSRASMMVIYENR